MAKPSPSHAYDPLLTALGKAIKEQRQLKGLSQESLALEVGIDRSYMGGIERGEHNVALVNIHKIANHLGLTAWELLRSAKI
jgi:transcriptional regulator with XRE-family HTH domain